MSSRSDQSASADPDKGKMTGATVQGQEPEPSKSFARDRRAREAASALEEYRAGRRAVDENTARLRALRLARDAARERETKPAKASKRVKRTV
jgi:hypothetical protein